MATAANFHDDSDVRDSDNTNFGETPTLLHRFNDLRYNHGRDRDEDEGFPGFRHGDRPSLGPLTHIAHQVGETSQFVVSDTRNVPDYTGDTQVMQHPDSRNGPSRFVTVPSRGGISNVRPRLTSTLRSLTSGVQHFSPIPRMGNNITPGFRRGVTMSPDSFNARSQVSVRPRILN